MKYIAITLLVTLAVFGCSNAIPDSGMPDPSKSLSCSDQLGYEIVFKPDVKKRDAHLMATLTNVSKVKHQVQVNPKEFHASLEVTKPDGTTYEVFDKRYRDLILTSFWIEPTMELSPNEKISWKVPVSDLFTLHGQPVTRASLKGCSIVSEVRVAIVPENKSYISDNATQRSNVIKIR